MVSELPRRGWAYMLQGARPALNPNSSKLILYANNDDTILHGATAVILKNWL